MPEDFGLPSADRRAVFLPSPAGESLTEEPESCPDPPYLALAEGEAPILRPQPEDPPCPNCSISPKPPGSLAFTLTAPIHSLWQGGLVAESLTVVWRQGTTLIPRRYPLATGSVPLLLDAGQVLTVTGLELEGAVPVRASLTFCLPSAAGACSGTDRRLLNPVLIGR